MTMGQVVGPLALILLSMRFQRPDVSAFAMPFTVLPFSNIQLCSILVSRIGFLASTMWPVINDLTFIRRSIFLLDSLDSSNLNLELLIFNLEFLLQFS